MARFQRVGAVSVLVLVVAGALGACANDEPSADGAGGTMEVEADLEAMPAGRARSLQGHDAFAPAAAPQRGIAYATTTDSDSGSGGSGGVAGDLAQSPPVGPSVIKTATVDLEVARDGLQEATRDSISIAGRFGGFVLSTSTQEDRHSSASVTLRVPADSFERALAELEGLGDVKAEQISGEDVGQEFVDLEARVRNLESQEAVLLRLMDRSQSVSDTIRVQRELQGVQLEIERLTGRLGYLRDQADMGTINMSFVEVGAPAHKPPSGVLAKAWAQAIDLALGVVAAVIVGTGFLIPVAVLALIAFLGLRAVRPRLSS